jgi:hypothetical protein
MLFDSKWTRLQDLNYFLHLKHLCPTNNKPREKKNKKNTSTINSHKAAFRLSSLYWVKMTELWNFQKDQQNHNAILCYDSMLVLRKGRERSTWGEKWPAASVLVSFFASSSAWDSRSTISSEGGVCERIQV